MEAPGSISVSRVITEHLSIVWPQIASAVRRGLRHGAGDTLSERELLSGIARGEFELWAVHDGETVHGGIVLQIVERERGTALIVLLVAGRGFHAHADKVQHLIGEYAELIGAYTIEAIARPGMARWLNRRGWQAKATIMELSDGRQAKRTYNDAENGSDRDIRTDFADHADDS